MNNKILILTLILIVSIAPLSFAFDFQSIKWDKKGEIITRLYQDVVDNNELEDKVVTDLMFEMHNKIWLIGKYLSITADIEARAETFSGYGTESDINLNFKENFLEFAKGNQRFTLGKKIVTWGKLDDVTILDRINPQDFTRFALFDKQDRKLPALMFKYDYSKDNWKIESVFMPIFKASTLKFFDYDWAVFDHLKTSIEDSSLSSSKKDIVRSISIQEDDAITDYSLKNSQVGLRFSSKIEDIDYSLYYMNIYNSIPVLKERTSVGNLVKKYLYLPTMDNLNALVAASPSGDDYILERAHPRINVIGADWETVLGEYGARGEIALSLGQPYLRQDFSYVEKDVLTAGFGLDHTTAQNIYFNIQFIIDHIFDYEGLFAQEENSKQLTGSISKDFLRGILLFNVDWFYSLSYTDWMINPSAEYKFNNGASVSLGSFLFGGDPTTVFGRFTSKDLIYLEMKYLF